MGQAVVQLPGRVCFLLAPICLLLLLCVSSNPSSNSLSNMLLMPQSLSFLTVKWDGGTFLEGMFLRHR